MSLSIPCCAVLTRPSSRTWTRTDMDNLTPLSHLLHLQLPPSSQPPPTSQPRKSHSKHQKRNPPKHTTEPPKSRTVLTTRSWRMSKSKEWPVLKIIMLLLRHLMPIEFIVLGEPLLISLSFLFSFALLRETRVEGVVACELGFVRVSIFCDAGSSSPVSVQRELRFRVPFRFQLPVQHQP